MNSPQESAGVFRVDFGSDAMAEVEHMTAALAIAGEDAPDFGADGFGFGVKHSRIHVALQGDFAADTLAGIANVAGPVQAQGVGTGIGNAFQPQTAVLEIGRANV